jgi:hypothetical protein
MTTIFAVFNIFFARLLSPFYMLIFVWFIKWDKFESPGQGSDDTFMTVRGYLPKYLSWTQTIDCPFPGGLYEPTVKTRLLKHGKIWCSYIWSGWRNPMGLSVLFAKPAIGGIPDYPATGWTNLDGTWYYERKEDGMFKTVFWIHKIKIEKGWEVYKKSNSSDYVRIPHFTLRYDRGYS